MIKDILGRPVQKGDIVLTNGYSDIRLSTTAIVKRVNQVSVTVELVKTFVEWEGSELVVVRTSGPMKRRPDQIVVVTEQLNDNKNTYPEAYL